MQSNQLSDTEDRIIESNEADQKREGKILDHERRLKELVTLSKTGGKDSRAGSEIGILRN